SRRHPVFLELDRPQPKAGLRVPPWTTTATLKLSLHEAGGERIREVARRVKQLETWLSLVRIDSSGVPLDKPVPLVLGRDGIFTGRVPISLSWKDLDPPTRLGTVS